MTSNDTNPDDYPDYPFANETADCPANGSDEASEWCEEYDLPVFRYSLPVTVLYCVAYVVVSLMGVVGNSFVVAVVVRAPRMRTVTNVFIANLAVADLLVNIIVLPTTLIANTLSGEWGPAFGLRSLSGLRSLLGLGLSVF